MYEYSNNTTKRNPKKMEKNYIISIVNSNSKTLKKSIS